jgi:hypothetical protein
MVKSIQKGITNDYQKWRQIGKIIVNQIHLNENTLNIKYPSNGSIPKFKKITISDEMKNIINEILDIGKLNIPLCKLLKQSEKDLLKRVLHYAGLLEQLGYKDELFIESIEDLRKRFFILQGEINANNNNPKLLDDAIDCIQKLIILKQIDKTEGEEMIIELQNA